MRVRGGVPKIKEGPTLLVVITIILIVIIRHNRNDVFMSK